MKIALGLAVVALALPQFIVRLPLPTGPSGPAPYYTGTLRGVACSDSAINSAISVSSSLDIIRVSPAGCTITNTAGNITIPSTVGILVDLNGGTYGGTVQITPNATFSSRLSCANTLTPAGNGTLSHVGGYPSIGAGALSANNNGLTAARWRLDHCIFTGSGTEVIDVGFSPGVIDHITMNGGQSANETIHANGWGAGDQTGWVTAMPSAGASRSAGTDEAVFFEDSTFSSADPSGASGNNSWFEGFYGTRNIFRFNTFNYFGVDYHGNNSAIGTRWWEEYHNDFHNLAGANTGFQAGNIRAGSGILFGNTFSGTMSPQPDFELCQENVGGVSQTYPSDDQPGRGLCSANPCTWGAGSNSVLDPAYAWQNNQAVNVNVCGGVGAFGNFVQFNQDVYTDVNGASCTSGGACTAGVGVGTALPTTCTVGVGFWKSNEGSWNTKLAANTSGRLYKCGPMANQWTLYYTPYTYPHALQTGLNPNK